MQNNLGVHGLGAGTIIVSLLIFGSFLLLFVNINTWLQGWGKTLTMSVYLSDDINELQRSHISKYINNLPNAKIRRYISKEAALKDLRNALGSQGDLLNELSRNPLPASFEISFEQSNAEDPDPRALKESLETLDGVTDAQYSEAWLSKFQGIMDMVRFVGFIIGGLLCMGVLFITTNTIKLTIYSRREEIEILKLVGATDWFVKMPYLFEGAIQGIFGGLVSVVVLIIGYLLLSSKKLYVLNFAVLEFVFIPNTYIIFILLISLFLGLIGSLIALGRFFDIK
jgi:cell division transport system permease protein